MKKMPYSVVLFSGSRIPACKKILGILDSLTDTFSKKIQMVAIDAEVSKDITNEYHVATIPSLAVFSRTKLLYFYKGAWTTEGITKLCESLTTSTVTNLEDCFDVFDFQKKEPINIIVSDIETINNIDAISQGYGGSIHIGSLSNQTLASQIGVEFAQIRRPLEGFVVNVSSLNQNSIQKYLEPLIERIESEEHMGSSTKKYSLVSLMDEKDPIQGSYISSLFKNLSLMYVNNISYQVCDFYKCNNIARSMNIIEFINPLFFLSSNTGIQKKIELFMNPTPQQSDIEVWLNEIVLGIKQKVSQGDSPLKQILAREFSTHVLDHTKDVLLLVASPTMPNYQESVEKALVLKELFASFKTIRVYEFNPITQLVPGLQMPKHDRPQISIWPAQQGQGGASFPADVPIPAMIDNILKMVSFQLKPAEMQSLAKKLETIMSSKKK